MWVRLMLSVFSANKMRDPGVFLYDGLDGSNIGFSVAQMTTFISKTPFDVFLIIFSIFLFFPIHSETVLQRKY